MTRRAPTSTTTTSIEVKPKRRTPREEMRGLITASLGRVGLAELVEVPGRLPAAGVQPEADGGAGGDDLEVQRLVPAPLVPGMKRIRTGWHSGKGERSVRSRLSEPRL